jgi:two-component system phosphate regulon sensor histidine kinase PhoR
VHRQQGSVCNVVRRAAQAFAEQAEARGTSLIADCPEDLSAPISGALLEQAIGNLVDNAIKYSGEGTSVSITARQEGDQVLIEVADQGPGIEEKHLPRIFERFYRVDRARSRALGGTGLGLSIVKHIALAHQGNVTVESTPGRGATFTIHLPAEAARPGRGSVWVRDADRPEASVSGTGAPMRRPPPPAAPVSASAASS